MSIFGKQMSPCPRQVILSNFTWTAPPILSLTTYMICVTVSDPFHVGCMNRTCINVTVCPKTRCISGYKLDSCTGKGLEGWTISVYNDSSQALMGDDVTDPAGYWEICELVPGLYRVTEANKDGWLRASPDQQIEIRFENLTRLNFTNQELLCISGYKLDDYDGAVYPAGR